MWAQSADRTLEHPASRSFYCGLVEGLYVFNGFFMSMRAKFVTPGTSIYYYVVEWDATATPWADFRGQVLGPTDPKDAPATSLRGLIYSQWEALGLAEVPNVGDNGVHASASPFEAMAERMNWIGTPLADDPFGAALLAAAVPEAYISAGTVDPQVALPGGLKGVALRRARGPRHGRVPRQGGAPRRRRAHAARLSGPHPTEPERRGSGGAGAA